VRRLLHRLRFFTRSALRGLRASPVTSAVAVATISVTLLLSGLFALLLSNMQDLLDRFGASLHVTVYLEDGLSLAQQEELLELASTIEGVEEVVLVTKDEALRRFEAGVGEALGLLDALEENPLPASLELTLTPEHRSARGLAIVAEALGGLSGIDDVGASRRWVEGYARAIDVARRVGAVLGVVLALATLLIVANTIRLAIYARREEIEILGLVGATRSFVAIPFLLEGVVQGLAGGALAVLLLGALYVLALPNIEAGLSLLLGFARPRFLGPDELAWLFLSGAALGALGSGAALVQGWRR
jgi:cell division transport system permease protein